MKPKKLIRKFITDKLKEGEWEEVNDIDELNKLYALKVREELAEIQESNHKDIMEFVDLIQVAFSFARMNGFTQEEISLALVIKSVEKGTFGKLALNNLNPANPSNKLYFKKESQNEEINPKNFEKELFVLINTHVNAGLKKIELVNIMAYVKKSCEIS